jgi:hypothetical protein
MPGPKPASVLKVIAIVVVIAVGTLALAAFIVVSAVMRHVRVAEHSGPNGNRVDVTSPFGDLNIRDDNKGHAVISSPIGGMSFDEKVDPRALGVDIYPGATMLAEGDHSAFHDDIEVGSHHHPRTPRLHMQMDLGVYRFTLNLAEFRTSDPPSKVVDFYRSKLQHGDGSFTENHKEDATELKQKIADGNERVVEVKQAGDGTHFVVVRVLGSQGGV